jgi:hypothetical protein
MWWTSRSRRAVAGLDPGLDPVSGPLFLVCTHGRPHHAVQSEADRSRGRSRWRIRMRPWESTHVGGDRFAGNVVAFPHGPYFGRVAPSHIRIAGRGSILPTSEGVPATR